MNPSANLNIDVLQFDGLKSARTWFRLLTDDITLVKYEKAVDEPLVRIRLPPFKYKVGNPALTKALICYCKEVSFARNINEAVNAYNFEAD